jgi:hypothetical protein
MESDNDKLKAIDDKLEQIGKWGHYRVLEKDEIAFKKVYKVTFKNGYNSCENGGPNNTRSCNCNEVKSIVIPTFNSERLCCT